MNSSDCRKDPEFIRLQKEIGELSRQLDTKMKEVQEKFPPRDGFAWAVNAAYTLGQFTTRSYDE